MAPRESYVTDVAYVDRLFNQNMPVWLSTTALLNGQPPLDGSRPLTYVDLGCGAGLTACAVAATSPSTDVWGFDFNPVHIERARSFVHRAGLRNCTFEERSFDELAGDLSIGPTAVDAIVLHGIISWVSAEQRRHVFEFIRRRLVPGGVVFVSYNVPTGWSTLVPVREAMLVQAATDPSPSDIAVRSTTATMRQLADDGALALALGRPEQSMMDNWANQDPRYLAHEYLGSSFHPMMFADVAAEMAAVKCGFVGECTPYRAVDAFRLPPGLAAVAADVEPALVETIVDLAGEVAFRRDVYRRGLVPATTRDRMRQFDRISLVGLARRWNPDATVDVAVGKISLDQDRYRPVAELLDRGPVTFAEIRATMASLPDPMREALLATVLLLTGGFVVPAPPAGAAPGSAEAAASMNQLLVEMTRDGQHPGGLVAPALGATVPLEAIHTLALGEVWDGVPMEVEAVAEATCRRIVADEIPVVHEGSLLDEDGVRALAPRAASDIIAFVRDRAASVGIQSPTRTQRRRGSRGAGRDRG